jgi:hypothetical protein
MGYNIYIGRGEKIILLLPIRKLRRVINHTSKGVGEEITLLLPARD